MPRTANMIRYLDYEHKGQKLRLEIEYRFEQPPVLEVVAARDAETGALVDLKLKIREVLTITKAFKEEYAQEVDWDSLEEPDERKTKR